MEKQTLHLQNVGIYVDNRTGQAPLVEGVCFSITSGEVYALVGESGSGKSLTCLAIMALLPPNLSVGQGRIFLNEDSLLGRTEKELQRIRWKRVAYVMQDKMNGFTPIFSIGEHFVETIRSHESMSKREAIELGKEHLERVGLQANEVWNKYPFELSGGMLQRAMIALSLSLCPSFLIVDEPTSSLDRKNSEHIIELFQEIKERYQVGMLLVSHSLDEVIKIADHVGVMCAGRLVESKPIQKLLHAPEHSYTRQLLQLNRRGSESTHGIARG